MPDQITLKWKWGRSASGGAPLQSRVPAPPPFIYTRRAVFPVDRIVEKPVFVVNKYRNVDDEILDHYEGVRKQIDLTFHEIAHYTSRPTGTASAYNQIVDTKTDFDKLLLDTNDDDGLGDPVALFKNTTGELVGIKNVKKVNATFNNVLYLDTFFTETPNLTHTYYVGLPILIDFMLDSGDKELVYKTANVSRNRTYKVKNNVDALPLELIQNTDLVRRRVAVSFITKALFTDLDGMDGF